MSDKRLEDLILDELRNINKKLDNVNKEVTGMSITVSSHELAMSGKDGLIQTVARHEQKLDNGNRSERVAAVTSVICTIIAIASLFVAVMAAGWAEGKDNESEYRNEDTKPIVDDR